MKPLRWLLLGTLLCLFHVSAVAQQNGYLPPVKDGFNPDMALTGRVLSPDGKPLPQARVSCVGSAQGPTRRSLGTFAIKTLAETNCDAEGRYRLYLGGLIKSGALIHNILAECEGWGFAMVQPHSATQNVLDIRLRPATKLRLTFVDDNGNFLPDVPVRLTAISSIGPQSAQPLVARPAYYAPSPFLPEEDKWRARTDAAGAVTFEGLPQGTDSRASTLTAHYAIEEKPLVFAESTRPSDRPTGEGAAPLEEQAVTVAAPEVLVVAPSASIAGRLTFADGKPVAGATVRVGAGNGSRETRTDASGVYKVAGLRAGTYNIHAVPPPDLARDWTVRPLENVVLQDKQPLASRNLILSKGAVIKGRVVSVESGKPVPDCWVSLYKNGTDYTEAGTSGADGTFEMRVPPGVHTVSAYTQWEAGYDQAQAPIVKGKSKALPRDSRLGGWKVQAADGQVLELEFRLSAKPKMHPVEVQVLDAQGQSVAGAYVIDGEISSPQRRGGKGWQQEGTNAQGKVSVQGPVLLRAFKDGAATPQAVLASGDSVTLRLVSNALSTLRGRVLDAGGAALPNAEVELRTADEAGSYLHSIRADANGDYIFTRLWPDMKYRVRAKGNGAVPAQSDVIKLRSGDNAAPALRLKKATAFVAGRVVNLKNQPVAGARVACSGADTGQQIVSTGPDGRFRFEGVVPELLSLSVDKDYAAPGTTPRAFSEHFEIGQTAHAGSDDVLFKLRHF